MSVTADVDNVVVIPVVIPIFQLIPGTSSGASGTLLSPLTASNEIHNLVDAHISGNADVLAGGDVNVLGTDTVKAVIISDAVTVGDKVAAFSLEPGGRATTSNAKARFIYESFTSAYIEASTVEGDGVVVKALAQPDAVVVAVAVAITSKGNVTTKTSVANTSPGVSNVEVGGDGYAQGIARLYGRTEAYIDGSTVTASADDVSVRAEDQGEAIVVAGSAAWQRAPRGGAKGIAASSSAAINHVEAYIDGSTVEATFGEVEVVALSNVDFQAFVIGAVLSQSTGGLPRIGGSLLFGWMESTILSHIDGASTVTAGTAVRGGGLGHLRAPPHRRRHQHRSG